MLFRSVNSKGLGVMGVSKDGMPHSWNLDHQNISSEVVANLSARCQERLNHRLKATDIKKIETKMYDDKSGGTTFFSFVRQSGTVGKAKCLFNTNKVVMLSTDLKSEYGVLK